MRLSDFDFDLPEELIAQEPSDLRDHSNLLIPSPIKSQIVKFYNLPDYLVAGDLLVFNNSKVINAKLILKKNNKEININLNRPIGDNIWLGFARPSRKLDEGEEFSFGKHKLKIKKKLEFGEIEIKVENGRATRMDGTLAGGVGTLNRSLQLMWEYGVGLEDAIDSVTSRPADLMGMGHLGRLDLGSPAQIWSL